MTTFDYFMLGYFFANFFLMTLCAPKAFREMDKKEATFGTILGLFVGLPVLIILILRGEL